MRSYVSAKAPKSYVRDFYNRMITEKGADFLFRGVYADVNFRLEHGSPRLLLAPCLRREEGKRR